MTFRSIFMWLIEYAIGAAAMALEKYDHPYIAPWVLIAALTLAWADGRYQLDGRPPP